MFKQLIFFPRAGAYLLLLVCTLLATHPLLREGFFKGGDFSWEIVRVAEYVHSLRAGIFPVRWGADLEGGYGYPIYNFFPPVFMFVAGVLSIAGGLSLLFSIKLTLFLLALASGVGMYWFASDYFGNRGGLFAAVLYVLFPYHFIDVFFRNAFAEFTAMAIAPFVFYGLARLLREVSPRPASVFVLAVSGTLFVLSHNLSVPMYAPMMLFFALFTLASTRQWDRIRALAVPLGLIFALTAFYTLPMMFERQYVQLWVMALGKFKVQNHFLTFDELTSLVFLPPPWWTLILTVLGIARLYRDRIEPPMRVMLVFFVAWLSVLVFMLLPASQAVWGAVKGLEWLQFPWRLLSPVSFIICFLSGAIVYLPSVKIRAGLMAVFVLLAVVSLMPLQGVALRGAAATFPDEALVPAQIRKQQLGATVLSEYLPVWVREKPDAPVENRLMPSRADAEIHEIESSAHRHAYGIATQEETQFTARLFYFPGWTVYVDGAEVKPWISWQGLMQFGLPRGRFQVELKFVDTPIRTLGNGLSLAGLLVLGWMLSGAAGMRPARVARRSGAI